MTRITFPAVQLVPANDRCRLIPKTIVRMSLVDERSTASNILDHFHCLVDCQSRAEPTWRVEREMNPDGTVLFEKFGIVKTLETDKVDRITKRIIDRKVENGDFKLSTDTWRKTEIRDRAEQQCGTVYKSCKLQQFLCSSHFRPRRQDWNSASRLSFEIAKEMWGLLILSLVTISLTQSPQQMSLQYPRYVSV